MADKPPLTARIDASEVANPFEKDLLARKSIAETLTGYLDRLRAGAVIGISAPWGEGKTYFGRNWCAQLKGSHRVAYIDAFENDYLDDPFLLIASELSELMSSDDQRDKLKVSATKVFKAIVPVGTKALINLAGRLVLGSTDVSETLAEAGKDLSGAVAEKSEKWLEDRFDELAAQRASLQGFRDALTEAVGREDNPVVIFIDELDRCKPSFAVTLIERLKHLFDVPNLVFVLLLNRAQLERSIEGHYGSGTDGRAYLGKFVNLWFDLPRPRYVRGESDHRMANFVDAALQVYRVPKEKHQEVENFREACARWAQTWELSLRDVERMCSLFVLGGMSGSSLATYLIAMKVKNSEMFRRLRLMDKAAHLACAEELEKLCPESKDERQLDYPELLYRCLAELHRVLVNDISMDNAPALQRWGRDIMGNFHNPGRAFLVVSDRIDLPVSIF